MVLVPLHLVHLLPTTEQLQLTLPPVIDLVPTVGDVVTIELTRFEGGTLGHVASAEIEKGWVRMPRVEQGTVRAPVSAQGGVRAPGAIGVVLGPKVQQGAVQAPTTEAGVVR